MHRIGRVFVECLDPREGVQCSTQLEGPARARVVPSSSLNTHRRWSPWHILKMYHQVYRAGYGGTTLTLQYRKPVHKKQQ